jgi:hypothetical protein
MSEYRMTEEEYFSQITTEEYFALPEPQQRRAIEVMLHELERQGFVEKKRDASGNVVTRPGKYGTLAAPFGRGSLGYSDFDRVREPRRRGPWARTVYLVLRRNAIEELAS